jgi:hypothetical protein
MAFCRSCGVKMLEDAEFCSKCGASQSGSSATTGQAITSAAPPKPRSLAGGGWVGLLVIVVGGGWCALRGGDDDKGKKEIDISSIGTPMKKAPADELPADKEPDWQTQIRSWTFAEAVETSSAAMLDEHNEVSPGSSMLLTWAMANMQLSDVLADRNETSFKRVMKDSESERGKRLCVTGRVIQIHREDVLGSTVYTGTLNTGSFDFIHFNAVRDTGSIVEGTRSRFCGVVTGRYSYDNVTGGTTHSIRVIGVFDIPSNRPPKSAPAPKASRRKGLKCVPPELATHYDGWEPDALANEGYKTCPAPK